MKTIIFSKLSKKNKSSILQRPSIDMTKTYQIVQPILADIKKNGIKSVVQYAKKFDGFSSNQIKVTENEINNSEKNVTNDYKKAIRVAVKNITKFHKEQLPKIIPLKQCEE
jgi:histidinol dehydrogenase